ncbi:MAG: hypothetical protein JWO03_2174 [Bacteroidetes bacterium]|nr:hypothetical protein [Bacteroidota bacterium]
MPNKYRNVEGTKHEEKGFISNSVWYEITPVPDGARDCSLSEGGMSLSNGCNCRYFLGEDMAKAQEAFNKVAEYMKVALGTPFVYTTEKPSLDMTIPSGTESMVTFGVKKKKGYESLPLVSLVLAKGKDNRYAVNMLFHDFGF